MNKLSDKELFDKLQNLETPLEDPAVKARTFERARYAFRLKEPAVKKHGFHFMSFAMGAALSACLVFFLVGRFDSLSDAKHSTNTLLASKTASHNYYKTASLSDEAEKKLLLETMQTFPGQFAALVRKGERSEIILSDASTANSKQPLIIELRKGKEQQRILTFSGQRLELEINGVKRQVEVLVSGDGAILLAGIDFIWSSKQPNTSKQEIRARSLGAVAL